MSQSAPVKPYTKPLPEPTDATRPYWDAAREGRLLLQRSKKIGTYLFYPRGISPFGTNDTLEFTCVPVSVPVAEIYAGVPLTEKPLR